MYNKDKKIKITQNENKQYLNPWLNFKTLLVSIFIYVQWIDTELLAHASESS